MTRLFYKKNIRRNKNIVFFIFIVFIFMLFYKQILYFVITQKNNIFVLFIEKRQLINSNKILQEENNILKSKSIIPILENRIIDLENEFKFAQTYNINKIFYHVFSTELWNDTYFFTAQEQNFSNINNGDLVFARNNILIGEVNYNDKNMVTLDLYSKPNKISELFLWKNNHTVYKVETTGIGGGIMWSKVPRNFVFNKNDKIYLVSPHNPFFVIGEYVKEEFVKQDPFKKIYFKLLVNPYLISNIGVLHLDSINKIKNKNIKDETNIEVK